MEGYISQGNDGGYSMFYKKRQTSRDFRVIIPDTTLPIYSVQLWDSDPMNIVDIVEFHTDRRKAKDSAKSLSTGLNKYSYSVDRVIISKF